METLLNDFSPGLFIVQAILFLALIGLMVKFAWKPILTSLNERESGIEDALAAAENARKEMQNLQADNKKLLKEAVAERDQLMKEAREMRDKIIAEAKDDAKEVTQTLIENAQAAFLERLDAEDAQPMQEEMQPSEEPESQPVEEEEGYEDEAEESELDPEGFEDDEDYEATDNRKEEGEDSDIYAVTVDGQEIEVS